MRKQSFILSLKNKSRQGVLEAIKTLKNDPNVAFVEPDYQVKACSTYSNDPYYYLLYGLEQIDAPSAWDITTGSSLVKIAVLDTGIDYNHENLYLYCWGTGIDYVNDDYLQHLKNLNLLEI